MLTLLFNQYVAGQVIAAAVAVADVAGGGAGPSHRGFDLQFHNTLIDEQNRRDIEAGDMEIIELTSIFTTIL